MEFRYALPEGEATVRVEPSEHGYKATILRPDQPPGVYHVDARRPEHGRLTLCLGERRLRAYLAHDGSSRYVALSGDSWRLEPPKPRGRKAEAGGGSLAASMPGKVLDVLVAQGQQVEPGAPLVILEAMKMELRITAPAAGVVAQVYVRPGDVVDKGQRLVELGEGAA